MRMQRKSMLLALLTMLFVGLSYLYAMKQVVKAEEFGDWEYRLINDGVEVEITDYNNTPNGDLQIPDSIDGKPVTSIWMYAFYDCSGLTSLELPSGLTSIATGAFSGCSGLTSLELPSGLTYIDTEAFKGCSDSLKFIVEEESITLLFPEFNIFTDFCI